MCVDYVGRHMRRTKGHEVGVVRHSIAVGDVIFCVGKLAVSGYGGGGIGIQQSSGGWAVAQLADPCKPLTFQMLIT